MGNYAKNFERKVLRALKNADGDLDLLFSQAEDLGTTPDALERMLLNDLANNGPIFGKFLSNLMGAAESGLTSAQRAGITAGQITPQQRADILGDMSDDDYERLVFGGDPDDLEAIESSMASREELVWVAELVNTCHLCLPLHGTALTLEEWRETGYDPETIHVNAGFNSDCKCRLVPRRLTEGREDLMAPLKRNQLEGKGGIKGNKNTARAVAGEDLEKAVKAMEKARDSEKGRRTLRMLGQSKAPQPEEVNDDGE